jgi:hypothetical protein
VTLTHEELSLLNKGLQHSIEKPLRKYWTDLIMETELTIKKLDTKMQAPYRILASKKLNQIRTSCNHHNTEAKRQSYILENLTKKLEREDAMIVKADKGKRVILYTNDYNKIENFLNDNNFQKLPQIPKRYHHNTTTMQHNHQQETEEISHKQNPNPLLKSTDQITQTRQPNQTSS